MSIPLRPQFGSWLGWVVPFDAPVLFVVDDAPDLAEVVCQARNVGYDQLLGAMAGVGKWAAAGYDLGTTPLRPVQDAAGLVVDVRQGAEFRSGHLPGALHVELGSLAAAELAGGPASVMCGHGERAMTAASLLVRQGRGDVTVLTGGPDEWADQRGPLEIGG